jgi:hypothetical protein
MIIGTVVKYIAHARTDAAMNMLYSPVVSIHGVRAKTMTIEKPLRTNATGTNALPMT